jgi:SSS family solute:Na+ symporter
MLPGIAAYVLHRNGFFGDTELKPDRAYAAILAYLPQGLRGLSMAALTAAIVASLAGKANSISTIFTLDIYHKYINPKATEAKMVWLGRVVIVIAMITAIAFTWNDTLGIGAEGGFTFIQKYTSYVSPGVFALFLLGMFWKRTTGAAAVAGVIVGFVLSVFFNRIAPNVLGNETFLYKAYPQVGAEGKIFFEVPFQVSMGLSFAFTVLTMVIVSLFGPKDNPKAFKVDKAMFRVAPSTAVMIVVMLMMLAALYVRFW